MTSHWYSRLPIAHKLRLLLMAGGLIFILCFGLIYIYYGAHSLRENLITETVNSANLIGSRNIAAIRFNNPDFAKANLEVVNADSSYEQICLYDAKADLFTQYSPAGSPCPSMKRFWNGMFSEFSKEEAGKITVVRNIVADGELVGGIEVRRNQRAVRNYVMDQLHTMLIISVISAIIGYIISNYLQRFISKPIMEMTRNFQTIAVAPTFEHRILRQHDDEMGKVADAFNRILTKMETRLTELSSQNAHLSRSYNLMIQRLEALMGNFFESLESFNTYSEMVSQNHLGPLADNYVPYRNDVAESLGIYSANFESFLKSSQIYAQSIADPRTPIDLSAYLVEFIKKLKATAPFISIELAGVSLSSETYQLNVYKAAWDEVFKILFNLYNTLSGLVEFAPQFRIEVSDLPLRLSITLFDKEALSAPIKTDQFMNLYIGAEEVAYRKNSIEDPEVGQDFMNDELFHRADMQFILDTIVYMGNANAISVDHVFQAGRFMITFDLSKLVSDSNHLEPHMALQ